MFETSTLYNELVPWFMLLIASLGIFIWRFLGLILSSKIRKDSFFATSGFAASYFRFFVGELSKMSFRVLFGSTLDLF